MALYQVTLRATRVTLVRAESSTEAEEITQRHIHDGTMWADNWRIDTIKDMKYVVPDENE